MNSTFEMLCKVFLLGMFENLFLVGYILIRLDKKVISEKSILLIFLVSCFSVTLGEEINFVLLGLIIRMIIAIGLICLFYSDSIINSKSIMKYFLYAFFWFALIESLVCWPMCEFIGFDLETIRQNTLSHFLFMIPSRIAEMLFLYIYHSINYDKKEKCYVEKGS